MLIQLPQPLPGNFYDIFDSNLPLSVPYGMLYPLFLTYRSVQRKHISSQCFYTFASTARVIGSEPAAWWL